MSHLRLLPDPEPFIPGTPPYRWRAGSLCPSHGAYARLECLGCNPWVASGQRAEGNARALDTLRLLQNHARREPVACPCGHNDVAAVRIAVRRLRGNMLT